MKKFKNKNLTASSKNWITRQFSDPYTKLAKQQGYRSRSAFKLIEINNKFKFLKNNLNIIDLGSAPGGWSQVCSEINKNGKNLSIDILDMDKIDNIFFVRKILMNLVFSILLIISLIKIKLMLYCQIWPLIQQEIKI